MTKKQKPPQFLVYLNSACREFAGFVSQLPFSQNAAGFDQIQGILALIKFSMKKLQAAAQRMKEDFLILAFLFKFKISF
jgi:hypothetical protein